MNLLLVVVAATLIISALCSLLEATLYSTRLATLEAAKGKGRHQRAAALFWNMKKNVGGPTAAILILNTVANTAGATVAGMLAAREFGFNYVFVFSAVFTLAILFCAEIVPKTYGAVHWRTLWPYVAWPLTVVQKGMKPMVWVTQKFSNMLVTARSSTLTTEDEVLAMIQLSARSGQLTSTELELLTAVFHFDELVCRQVMVPRNEVVHLEKAWPLAQCIEVARKTQHTRYPLCDGPFESPLGIVHVKDLLGVDDQTSMETVLRPIRCVPETMPIPTLLREMKSSQQHMALVVDEHGSSVGIVTLENILEQIVGSVQDEFDKEEPDIAAGQAGTFLVLGGTPVSSVNRQLAICLPNRNDVDTLSGLLVQELGRLLKVGDKADFQGVAAEVLQVEGNRATKIRLTVPESTDQE